MIKVKSLTPEVSYASNSYLILGENECAVVDPSCPFSKDALESKELKYILITHAHFDHFIEIDEWVKNTNASVIISKKDRESLKDSQKNCYALFLYKNKGYYGDVTEVEDGDCLDFENEKIYAYEYPGHTVGSLIYKLQNYAFSGDLAFENSGFGRYDLPGGDYHSLLKSLRKFIQLDSGTVIMPGHGNSFTIDEYRKHIRI